jgi:predicted esterase
MASTAALTVWAVVGLALWGHAAQKQAMAQDPAADVADVPVQDLRVGGDAKKQFFLIGKVEGSESPPEGCALLVVLPGGDGNANFQPFVRRMYKYALDQRWLVAQAVAPNWGANSERIVWPTAKLRFAAAKFTTEDFIQAIIADVQAKAKIDSKRIFLLGWSSGGPPCYAITLRKDSPVTGAFIAMSVFQPNQLPALENAKGKAVYLLQSPGDRVTPFRFAEAAEKALRGAGATVRLERYEGGHGWNGPVWQMIGDGVAWLDEQAGTKP